MEHKTTTKEQEIDLVYLFRKIKSFFKKYSLLFTDLLHFSLKKLFDSRYYYSWGGNRLLYANNTSADL